jgi:hypothetical protein
VFIYSISRIKSTTDKDQAATETVRHYGGMDRRTDLTIASRVNLALTLLPVAGWLRTSVALAAYGVPVEVAARVLVLPIARRTIDENQPVIKPIS